MITLVGGGGGAWFLIVLKTCPATNWVTFASTGNWLLSVLQNGLARVASTAPGDGIRECPTHALHMKLLRTGAARRQGSFVAPAAQASDS